MDSLDELLYLMDLEKSLKPIKYDRLNLNKLNELRAEVKRRLDNMKDVKLC